MIEREIIKESTDIDLYIKYSVIIDLDTLKIIHQKLVNSNYTKITYKFSARYTKYTCYDVNEIKKAFQEDGISEISELDISCKNGKDKYISMRFGKFLDYYFQIHSSDFESRNLVKEIFTIVEEKNIRGYKGLSRVISQSKSTFEMLLIVTLFFGYAFSKIATEFEKYAGLWKIYAGFFCVTMILFIFVTVFYLNQEVKIIRQKKKPFTNEWFRIFKDIIVSAIGSGVFYLFLLII